MNFMKLVVPVWRCTDNLQFVSLGVFREASGHGDRVQDGNVGFQLELTRLRYFSQDKDGVAIQILDADRDGGITGDKLLQTFRDPLS